MTMSKMLDEFYEAYRGQTPDTYFESVRKKFSRKGICQTEDQEKKCSEILDRYEGEILHAYCCGELIPIPVYYNRHIRDLTTELGNALGIDMDDIPLDTSNLVTEIP